MARRPPLGWYPRRGEVYLADYDKLRPVAILSVNGLNRFAFDVCVVPFTTIQHGEFKIRPAMRAGDGGLMRDCWAKCDQVTTLEKTILRYPALGVLSEATLRMIEERVKMALGFTS